jgi:hypothetical protein
MVHRLPDPINLTSLLWPDVYLYDRQREIAYSVWNNKETDVAAANKMGKDFIAALMVLLFALSRYPFRVVTTSAKDDHLDVLWGEMLRFIQAAHLSSADGGPFLITHHDIRKIVNGRECDISYIKGMVAGPDSIAAMQGHHVTPRTLEEANDGIPRSFYVSDESSSVPQAYYDMASTWFQRALIFGNAWECNNSFKWAFKGRPGTTDKGGDIVGVIPGSLYRRTIRIKGDDSPNVRLAHEEIRLGMKPSHRIIVPGVLTYAEYLERRANWDAYKQCVSLDADWYEGAENRLFPPEWLNRAEQIACQLTLKRIARTLGVDCAMGGDSTSYAVSDELGLIYLESSKTPNTADIPKRILALKNEYHIEAENIVLDAGGGGWQIADRLREQGHNVRTVAFGEAATLQNADKFKRGIAFRAKEAKVDEAETKYIYKNRRAEMYGLLRQLLDPVNQGWGIPSKGAVYAELRRQLAAIPLWYDEEGRLYLPPKNRKPDSKDTQDKPTLTKLLGCSPDEADAVVLSVFGMVRESVPLTAGAI